MKGLWGPAFIRSCAARSGQPKDGWGTPRRCRRANLRLRLQLRAASRRLAIISCWLALRLAQVRQLGGHGYTHRNDQARNHAEPNLALNSSLRAPLLAVVCQRTPSSWPIHCRRGTTTSTGVPRDRRELSTLTDHPRPLAWDPPAPSRDPPWWSSLLGVVAKRRCPVRGGRVWSASVGPGGRPVPRAARTSRGDGRPPLPRRHWVAAAGRGF